jgi:Sec-independent protein translocase protein TatA
VNIFGVGGAELVLIFVIMLVVAGPKRMLRWAYVFGQFVGKLRTIWDNVMEIIQAEVDAAGMDVEIPRELPTRRNVTKWFNEQTRDVTNPLQEDIDRIENTLGQARRDLGAWNKSTKSQSADNGDAATPSRQTPPAQTSKASQTAFGSWTDSDNAANGNDSPSADDNDSFGAWANPERAGQHAQQKQQEN